MREVNARKVSIMMVDGTVFCGYTNVGASRRTSDYFNRNNDDAFVVLFEATKGNSGQREVYFLNRNHIMWVKPEDHAPGTVAEDIVAISIEAETEQS